MGELGDDVIMDIDLNYRAKQMIESGLFGREMTQKMLIVALYNSVYRVLRAYINKWIDVKVPSDTEALRESMKNALTPAGGSKVEVNQGFPMLVIMNTRGIDYAKVVNKMPSSALQHPGNHWYTTGRTGNVLDDEEAQTGWYNWILLMGRNEAQRLFRNFIRNDVVPMITPVAASLGMNGTQIYNAARQMFSATFS